MLGEQADAVEENDSGSVRPSARPSARPSVRPVPSVRPSAPWPPCGFFGSREIQMFGSRELQSPEFWDLEIQKFGIQHMKRVKILKIQIRSAQNVGKVWMSGEKSSWPHLVPFQVFFPWAEKQK